MLKKMLILVLTVSACMSLCQVSFAEGYGEVSAIHKVDREAFYHLVKIRDYSNLWSFLKRHDNNIFWRLNTEIRRPTINRETQRLKAECEAWVKLCKEGEEALREKDEKFGNMQSNKSTRVTMTTLIVYSSSFSRYAGFLQKKIEYYQKKPK